METQNTDSKTQKSSQAVNDLLAAMKNAVAERPNNTIPSFKGSSNWQEQNAKAIVSAIFPHLDKKLSAEPTSRAEWRRSSLYSLLGQKEERV